MPRSGESLHPHLVNAMLEVAELTETTEFFSWTAPSRHAARLAASYLRQEAEEWARRASSSLVLQARARARTSRIEHFLRQLGRWESRLGQIRMGSGGRSPSTLKAIQGFEEVLHDTRTSLHQYLQEQRNRAPYEDLSETLRHLLQFEHSRGNPARIASYQEMLDTLEEQLGSGHFDVARSPDEHIRDLKILDLFRSHVAHCQGQPRRRKSWGSSSGGSLGSAA